MCLFAPCTKFQVTTNVDGANSTKPLLWAVGIFSRMFNRSTKEKKKKCESRE